MDTQPVTSQPANAPAPSSGTANAASDALISSDFETFLTLLTTQLQNQDPLNPLESTDFAVQLATFSGVEQQVRTNDLLAGLVSGMSASGVGQLASWVGMEARIDAPARFAGASIRLSPEPDPASATAALVVTNASGFEVAREAVPATGGPVLWAGTRADGSPLPYGQYTFTLESYSVDGTLTSTKTVEHYALVREARAGADGTEIVTDGGAVIASDSVTALRKPDA